MFGCPVFRIVIETEEERRTFFESVIPVLQQQGLIPGFLKKYGHGPGSAEITEGSDMIVATCPHLRPLRALCRCCDVVFVTGAEEEEAGLEGVEELNVRPFQGESDAVVAFLLKRAKVFMQAKPVWGCVLIGGKSSRMGSPKHLLIHPDGTTWLERNIALLDDRLSGVVISGRGVVPDSLSAIQRIPDVPGIGGPLSGILALHRWQPDVSWVILACDLPAVTGGTIDWLCRDGALGRWAKIPKIAGRERGEPLLARYEPQCGPVFEEMACSGRFSLHPITTSEKVDIVEVPLTLQDSWRNVNTPAELENFRGGKS